MKDQKVEATGVIVMKPEEAKSLYPGEWIAFRAFEESDNPEGELVLHNKDCRAIDVETSSTALISSAQKRWRICGATFSSRAPSTLPDLSGFLSWC